MEAWDYANDRQYRWIHPGYIESHVKESQERDIDWMVSIDNCRFINLELPQDILKKATAIAAEEEYDDRIMIQLTLSDPQQIMLMEMAHEADMSLNQFVEKILREKMARHGIEI
jgi:predicted HTH domain antitoxin